MNGEVPDDFGEKLGLIFVPGPIFMDALIDKFNGLIFHDAIMLIEEN